MQHTADELDRSAVGVAGVDGVYPIQHHAADAPGGDGVDEVLEAIELRAHLHGGGLGMIFREGRVVGHGGLRLGDLGTWGLRDFGWGILGGGLGDWDWEKA